MANQFRVGQGVRLSGPFTVDGVATDPTTVTLKVMDPSGNASTYTYALGQVTKLAVGSYYKDLVVDEGGVWYWEWIGTGACAAVDADYFEVLFSIFS
jgi:hypothetical protein